MYLTVIVAGSAGALLLVLVVASGLRIVREHERGVVFRLGRLNTVWRPGLHWMLPLRLDRLVRVDARIGSIEVHTHDAITLDQAMVRLVADVYYQVVDPQLAVSKVADHRDATAAIAEGQLRSVVGKVTLDDLLGMRAQLGPAATKVVDDEVEPWGVRVVNVEIKDVLLSEAMQRALARQAEAERDRQSKLAAAETELQAARALAEAAGMMADHPEALQLRYLQTLSEIGSGRSTVVVFPVPIDLLQSWFDSRARLRNGHAETEVAATGRPVARSRAPTADSTPEPQAPVPAPVTMAPPAPEPPSAPPAPPEWPEWYRPR